MKYFSRDDRKPSCSRSAKKLLRRVDHKPFVQPQPPRHPLGQSLVVRDHDRGDAELLV
jgi:hypothetical protein